MINNNCYELYLHSNNYISILKNNLQIALVKKAEVTIEEQNTYKINLDENLEKKEKAVGFDKLYYRTSWKPEGITNINLKAE